MTRFFIERQKDTMDCGPACLKMIARYHGKNYTMQDLRDRCHINRNGVSLLGIKDAAESIGLHAIGVKISWNEFKTSAPLPCIVHWNQQHFVVIIKIRTRCNTTTVTVADPSEGILEYKESSFLKGWCFSTDTEHKGISLFLEPTPDFYKKQIEEEPFLIFRTFIKIIRPYEKNLLLLFIIMIFASLLGLLFPFIAKSLVDDGIRTKDLDFVVILLCSQFFLVLGQLINNFIQNRLMLNVSTKISISLISEFLKKLMCLPISFFDSKRVGDIMQRIGDHGRIQVFLTSTLLSAMIAILSFIIYSIVISKYNTEVLLLFTAGSACYICWSILFMKHRRKIDFMRFQEASLNQSNMLQLINGIQDIKLNKCEEQKRHEWVSIQNRLLKVNESSLKLKQTQDFGGTCIDQCKNIMISYISAKAVITGTMTLGMMMSIQYILGQLNAPISQFIMLIHSFQDAKLSMERLNEINTLEDEEKTNTITDIPYNSDIYLKNVSYYFDGPSSPNVLKNINITIPCKKTTAIVGLSGSGKTTILKMLLGFYTPVSGQILIGDRPLSDYSISKWRTYCGAVLQDGYIFSDTIERNIALSDPSADVSKLQNAARIANLTDWINTLPLGYNTVIGAEGRGISNGQRQRILIARAIYKESPYLLFDEATNSLDANNEHTIMNNLHSFLKERTVVIVAHRLSTIKNADNIIMIENGRVVAQGTHTELKTKSEKYLQLLQNQLETDLTLI